MTAGKLLFAAAAALVLGLLAIAYAIPREARVQREIRIDAAPAAVFDLVEDARRHDLWMPWSDLRPRPQVVFGSESRGPGATYFWIGDHTTHGTWTLESADAPRALVARVDLASVDEAELAFHFAEDGAGTVVRAEFRKDLGFNPIRRYLRASHRRAGEALLAAALPRLKRAAEEAGVPPAPEDPAPEF